MIHNSKRYFNTATIFLLVLMLGLGACTTDTAKEPKTPKVDQTKVETKTKYKKVPVPKFDIETAYNSIEKQVSFGPRVPNSDGHEACKNWLVEEFKKYGADVIEQAFEAKVYTGTTLHSTNIIARFNPESKKRVLLSAHWDTRHIADQDADKTKQTVPILGADDGGSGVGVLLSIAKSLKENPMGMGIDIVLFDAEDHGYDNDNPLDTKDYSKTWCLGSQYWSTHLHIPGYKAKFGINLDMVGSKNARFTLEEISMRAAGNVMRKVWKLGEEMGYGAYFVKEQTRGITDDHYFVNINAKIPTIDIINRPKGTSSGFGHYWHTHKDNMGVISKKTLRAVGQTVLATIYNENNGTF